MGQKFCHSCGEVIDRDSIECPECGAGQFAKAPKKKSGCLKPFVAAGLLFLALKIVAGGSTDKNGSMLYHAINGSENEKSEQPTAEQLKEQSKVLAENIKKANEPPSDELLETYLEMGIKKIMNDPDSYEHVKTEYSTIGKNKTITISFRGKNAFNATILQKVRATYNAKGEVLKIEDL